MHREGHVGAALLVYAPLGFIVTLLAGAEAAIIGAVGASALAMVPDWDMRVPFVKHRGPTHTVHFAVLVGIILGIAGAALGAQEGIVAAIVLGIFGVVLGALTIASHIAADALTPMGVKPFRNGQKYSFDVARAANPIANYGLLALGVIALAGAAVLGLAFGG